ncbi:unnamed protein product, partial [Effrenium voratum]
NGRRWIASLSSEPAMGGRVARAAVDLDDAEFQDDVFPWFHLIQWSAEDATNNRVFRYDLKGAQSAAKALTTDVETFLRKCPEELPKSAGFTMDDDTYFAEWAGALLEWNPELRMVRFQLVPRRLSEVKFWSRFFAALRGAIAGLLFQDSDGSDGPDASDGPEEPETAESAGSFSRREPARCGDFAGFEHGRAENSCEGM